MGSIPTTQKLAENASHPFDVIMEQIELYATFPQQCEQFLSHAIATMQYSPMAHDIIRNNPSFYLALMDFGSVVVSPHNMAMSTPGAVPALVLPFMGDPPD